MSLGREAVFLLLGHIYVHGILGNREGDCPGSMSFQQLF